MKDCKAAGPKGSREQFHLLWEPYCSTAARAGTPAPCRPSLAGQCSWSGWEASLWWRSRQAPARMWCMRAAQLCRDRAQCFQAVPCRC